MDINKNIPDECYLTRIICDKLLTNEGVYKNYCEADKETRNRRGINKRLGNAII